MKKYTKEELETLGMSEHQINLILNSYGNTENNTNNVIEFKDNQELKVTSISELKKYSYGNIVELPGFGNGQPFVARLKRPSLLVMCKTGQIPNTLLNQASSLFANGANSLNDKGTTISDMYDIMEKIAEAAFVEPTYKELKENGIELSDDQLMAVFSYTQQGVKALENFRNK